MEDAGRRCARRHPHRRASSPPSSCRPRAGPKRSSPCASRNCEDQVRNLTGQVEGLQFSIGQMQTQLQQMADDNEFRFQQLEGGGAGKTEAAPQSGGETPPAEAPQPDTGTQTPDPAACRQCRAGGRCAAGVSGSLTEAPVADDVPMDDLGDSADPLLGQGQSGAAPTGTLGGEQRSTQPQSRWRAGARGWRCQGAVCGRLRCDRARRLCRSPRSSSGSSSALYPQDPQAPDATNWLGEALLQRQAYDEAADVLLTGFQAYERSARAPDLLLKLGIALAGAGEIDTACRTYFEVTKRYPEPARGFHRRGCRRKGRRPMPGLTPAEIEALFAPLELVRKTRARRQRRARFTGADAARGAMGAGRRAGRAFRLHRRSRPRPEAAAEAAMVVREAEALGLAGAHPALGGRQARDRHPGRGAHRALPADGRGDGRGWRRDPRSLRIISPTRPRPC